MIAFLSVAWKIGFVAGLVAVIVGLARAANNSRGPGRIRGPRRSWLVAAWNASGAKPVTSPRLGEAAAELAGRATGGTVRGGRKLVAGGWSRTGARALPWAGRRIGRVGSGAGRSAAGWGRRRWDARGPRQPLLWSRTRRDEQVDPAPQNDPPKPTPPPTPPPQRPPLVPVQPGETVTTPNVRNTSGDTAGSPVVAAAPTAASPVDWAVLCGRVANFEPENDAALIEFMAGELAGMLGYARSLTAVHETCVQGLGLDPTALQGIADFSVATSDGATAMATAHRRFITVYREVMEAVANGVKLPFRGRFFGGQG